MSRASIHLLKWLLPAFLVALVECTLAPEPAQAGCGDYVMLGVHASQHAESGPTAGGRSENVNAFGITGAAGSSGPIRPGGCSGPQCSKDAPRPSGTPGTPKIVLRDWAIVPSPVLRDSSVPQFANRVDEVHAPQHFALSIYRPPR